MRRGRWGTPSYTTSRGEKVRSKFEKQVLDDLAGRGVPYAYEKDRIGWLDSGLKGLECGACGNRADVYKRRIYVPDITLAPRRWVEIKGRFTPDDRKTLLGAKRTEPDAFFGILFMKDNTLSAAPKSRRYSDWAKANGFPYHVGTSVPEEWLR